MQHFYSALPNTIIYNTAIEDRLNLPAGWIVQRTGIEKRHKHDAGVSELAIQAAQECIVAHSIDPLSIDAVLMATVTPDHHWPATACVVAHAVGATNAWALDISAACSGFVYALQYIQALLSSQKAKRILLITGDCMSAVIDPQDKNTSILFGDACAASLWTNDQSVRIEDVYIACDGSGYNDIIVQGGGSAQRNYGIGHSPHLHLEGGKVFRAAISKLESSIEIILERNGISQHEVDWFIPHQANLRIIETLITQLNFPQEKVLTNVQWRGNTTNASIPLCWSDHQHCIKSGHRILVASFGAGYTYGSALLHVK